MKVEKSATTIDMPKETAKLIKKEDNKIKWTIDKILNIFLYSAYSGFAGSLFGYAIVNSTDVNPSISIIPVAVFTILGFCYGYNKYTSNKE